MSVETPGLIMLSFFALTLEGSIPEVCTLGPILKCLTRLVCGLYTKTRTTMSRPQRIQSIPPDIIDHVFSFLQSDPTTLVKCSHAHPNLSPIAERLLYADIVVFDKRNLEDIINREKSDRQTFIAAEFHKSLIDSPHIANYVLKLEICLTSLDGIDIIPILPMLMQLESISVTATFHEYWLGLSKEFRAAFMDRLSSPLSILKEVSIIYFCGIPLHI